ncbi:MAG: substrate binding domain-containing protein [Deltaproteobacteria bacterium]|nr:substrate binding domain-containing protein [Deltaproteobacteria bacterium]MBP7285561.1 substrate binding domain-containing protein [Nannocystaceae bacterium]
MSEPLETTDLLAFATTVDARSLSRAAAELGVPRSTLGRRLSRLERRLGVRLLRRSTRSLAVSEAGEALYRHARLVLDAVAQAEASVRRDDSTLRGDLRVSVPPVHGSNIAALVRDFAIAHPEVRVHVNVTTQMVDLRRGGYDVALRASMQLEPGLMARTVGRSRVVAVASAAYLARAGTPRRVEDLRAHRCIQGFERGELPATHWTTARGRRVAIAGAMSCNDMVVLEEAVRAGLGIALMPLMVVSEALQRGELVRVLPGIFEREVRLSVVFVERELQPAAVRAFIDALVRWGEQQLGASMRALDELVPPPRSRSARPTTAREPRARITRR